MRKIIYGVGAEAQLGDVVTWELKLPPPKQRSEKSQGMRHPVVILPAIRARVQRKRRARVSLPAAGGPCPYNAKSFADWGEPTPAGVDAHVYSRSNTRMLLGVLSPTERSVIVKVLRSVESSICRVPVILPLNLSVTSRLRSFTRRPEYAVPFSPPFGSRSG